MFNYIILTLTLPNSSPSFVEKKEIEISTVLSPFILWFAIEISLHFLLWLIVINTNKAFRIVSSWNGKAGMQYALYFITSNTFRDIGAFPLSINTETFWHFQKSTCKLFWPIWNLQSFLEDNLDYVVKMWRQSNCWNMQACNNVIMLFLTIYFGWNRGIPFSVNTSTKYQPKYLNWQNMLILNRTGYNLVMGIEKSIFKPLTPHIEDFCRFLFKEFAL